MTNEICDRLVRIVEQLPDRDIARIAAALDVAGGLARVRSQATSPIVRSVCDEVRQAIAGTSGSFVAGVLLGALDARQRQRRTVDVVWSGPPSNVKTSRLTSAAVVDLVDQVGDPADELRECTMSPAWLLPLSGGATRSRDHARERASSGQSRLPRAGHSIHSSAGSSPALAREPASGRGLLARQGAGHRQDGRAGRQRQRHEQRGSPQPRMRAARTGCGRRGRHRAACGRPGRLGELVIVANPG